MLSGIASFYKGVHCSMFVLVTSLCLAFSCADIEFHIHIHTYILHTRSY